MRIINDSDTTKFIDEQGDYITLLDCPRQRDLEKSRQMEQEDAFANFENLKKAMGEQVIADFQTTAMTDPEAAKAQAENVDFGLPLDVRCFRLSAIARELSVGGQHYGGQAILDAYEKMDADSAAWVDEQVATVWAKALPSDVARERGGAGVGGPIIAGAAN